jgi:hypothetical protein
MGEHESSSQELPAELTDSIQNPPDCADSNSVGELPTFIRQS